MSHRIWRESRLQPSRARSGNLISCCLISLHFLCDILQTFTVMMILTVLRKETSSASLSPSAISAAAGENSIYNHFPIPLLISSSARPQSQLSIPIATLTFSDADTRTARRSDRGRRVLLAPAHIFKIRQGGSRARRPRPVRSGGALSLYSTSTAYTCPLTYAAVQS